ncbi:MAG: hypothetical protein S4CHLAM2_07280 [Chlamydiales bacterium]|nr:hypothetical protein [Chlamydiales bacterium]
MVKWLWIVLCALPLFGSEDSLQRLMEGNQRYVQGDKKRAEIDQSPFAVVVACSDSRVAPELVFDQSRGELFVVRVAGNIVGDIEMESIRFAVEALGSSLVMVMGHEGCGAVAAVMDHQTKTIPALASLIEPAVKGKKTLEAGIKANVAHVVRYLDQSLKVEVVGSYYDFETGKVELVNTL